MVRAYVVRADSRREKGLFNEAIDDCAKALIIAPNCEDALFCRANTLSTSKNFSAAMPDLDRAISLKPDFYEAHRLRGQILNFQGEYRRALEDFNECVRIAPTSAEIYVWLALVQATCPDEKCRDGFAAFENAKRACELTGWQYRYPIEMLAAASAEQGDFASAIKWQKVALSKAQDDKEKAESNRHMGLYEANKPLRIGTRN
jgi:tetratricopeptide (TPR) repeat protein